MFQISHPNCVEVDISRLLGMEPSEECMARLHEKRAQEFEEIKTVLKATTDEFQRTAAEQQPMSHNSISAIKRGCDPVGHKPPSIVHLR